MAEGTERRGRRDGRRRFAGDPRAFREEKLFDAFPGRTEGDLRAWVAENLCDLREELGDGV